MTAAVGDLIQDALAFVGEAAGPSVQEYSEDEMRKNVVRSFNLLFKKFHWHQYRQWLRLELDGTLGIVTTNDLQALIDFEDIIGVYPDGKPTRLPLLPRATNPFAIPNSSGQIAYWSSKNVTDAYYATRRLQFWPKTATGFVNIGFRAYPKPVNNVWVDDDIMYLDKDMLTYGAGFMTLVGDDLNPSAANMAQQLMENTFKNIMNSFADQPIAMGPGVDIPTNWSAA